MMDDTKTTDPARPATVSELKALLADREVRHADVVASLVKSLHQTEEGRRRVIRLAIKATELSEVLGAAAEGAAGWLAREIRDELVSMSVAP